MTAITWETADRAANFPIQVGLLTKRLLLRQLRNPAALIPNILISVFFLLVYDGSLGGAAPLGQLVGGSFINFILPVSIVSAAVSGASAGQVLVEDLESRYFRRQLGMPLSRWAIVGAPMLLGAIQVLFQTILILLLGVVLGASSAAGFLGYVVVMALAFLWGMAFAGYSVGAGLRTGNAQAAQAATILFFPLLFLTTTFVPKEALKPWMEVAATINPTTYVLEGMRSLLIQGWRVGPLLQGFAAVGAFAGLTLTWAWSTARRVTRRG